VGAKALYNNTDRSNLVAVGDSALFNNGLGATQDYEAAENTAIGSKALYSNTTGFENTASGNQALYSNTEGYDNTAIGLQALFSNTTGNSNTASGSYALTSNTSGWENTASGSQALYSNTDGLSNTASGSFALYNNTTGCYNTANGLKALYNNTHGYFNVASGHYTLSGNTDGWNNTASGVYALRFNTTGILNTALGYDAGPSTSNPDLSNTTALGNDSRVTDDNQVRIGNSDVTSIGGYADWTNLSDERYKTRVQENVAGLDFILRLRPVTYHLDMNKLAADLGEDQVRDEEGNMKTGTPSEFELASRNKKAAILYTGFLAQEVETAAKSIGYDFSGVDAPKNENGIYGLRYAEFVVPLVKAVQELAKQNDQLKADNAALEARLAAVESRLTGK